MDQPKSFFRTWVFVMMTILMVIFGASIGITTQALRMKGKPQRFISQAKLVTDSDNISYGNQYQDYMPPDLYTHITDTLESSEMRRRAFERLEISTPTQNHNEVTVRVANQKGSRIFIVRAFTAEQKFAPIFLDALLEECVAFYNQNTERSKGKTPTVKVLEWASPPVADNEEWIRATAIGAGCGGLAGLLVSFTIGKLITVASLRKMIRP